MDYANHRVHPTEPPSPAPPSHQHQSKYVMLNNTGNSGPLRPPPHRSSIAMYHPTRQSDSRGRYRRCVCFCFCFWVVLTILLASLLVLLYSILQPQLPVYNVNDFKVNSFNVDSDFSLYSEFVVTVKSENPNENIGFTYGKDSAIVVTYSDSTLCSGELPAYHQPRKNTTVMSIVLKGKSEFGSGLQEALLQNQDTGRVPLLVMVRAPVSVVVRDFPLREVVVYVNCSLVVDNLSPTKKARILSTTYSYNVGLV